MSTDTRDLFSSYTYGEGKTAIGQIVKFTCRQGDNAEVAKFLREKVRTIDVPTTGRVNVPHGGYGRYTRYDIVQHKYAGGGPDCGGWAYIEVLEIKDAPDGRKEFVIHQCDSSKGSFFSEWQTLDDAINAFEKMFGAVDAHEEFPKRKGFLRFVNCGTLTPWFYAIGDQELIGDYAFPEGVQNDPVYTFGRKFVVYDSDGIPSVKTCMGTRHICRRSERDPSETKMYRVVYFDDGSFWNEGNSYSFKRLPDHKSAPRPLQEDELWITDAIQQFRLLLAGKSTSFTINFADGNKFVGKLSPSKENTSCAEGDYQLSINVKGEEPMKGWIRDFKPTKEIPNIIAYVTKKLASQDKVVESIEILRSKTKANGKKWAGVYYNPSKSVS